MADAKSVKSQVFGKEGFGRNLEISPQVKSALKLGFQLLDLPVYRMPIWPIMFVEEWAQLAPAYKIPDGYRRCPTVCPGGHDVWHYSFSLCEPFPDPLECLRMAAPPFSGLPPPEVAPPYMIYSYGPPDAGERRGIRLSFRNETTVPLPMPDYGPVIAPLPPEAFAHEAWPDPDPAPSEVPFRLPGVRFVLSPYPTVLTPDGDRVDYHVDGDFKAYWNPSYRLAVGSAGYWLMPGGPGRGGRDIVAISPPARQPHYGDVKEGARFDPPDVPELRLKHSEPGDDDKGARGKVSGLLSAYHRATEGIEVLDAAIDALPGLSKLNMVQHWHVASKTMSAPPTWYKLYWLYHAYSAVRGPEFARNLIFNHYSDQVIGRAAGRLGKLRPQLAKRGIHGPSTTHMTQYMRSFF